MTTKDRLTKGCTLWFTGLSGSGKSSVAVLVEQKLIESGCPAYILDGDNLRHGLNADLRLLHGGPRRGTCGAWLISQR